MRHWVIIFVTLAVAVATGWTVYVASDPRRMPVAAVQIDGDLRYLSRPALAQAIAGPASEGFFRVELGAVQAALLALPWVKDAKVRRDWPDHLHVAIRERVPAARWVAGGLVDAEGTLFHPPAAEYPPGLPALEGPDGTQALVLQRYREFRDWLAASGWRVDRVAMDARRAWRIDTDRGVMLVLGREPGEGAVRRVARVLPALLAQTGEALALVDLRYPNGFAARWRPPVAVETKPEGKPEGKPELRERHGKEDR